MRQSNEQVSLPFLTEGAVLSVSDVVLKQGQTTAPKHFTEDTLLSGMETAGADDKVNCPVGAREGGLGRMPDETERKGIGTPATRAATIEKLVQKGFIERRGEKKTKYLFATDKGSALVTVVPEQIQSPSMTADWEEKLLEVERGTYSGDAFMGEITDMVSGFVKNSKPVQGAEVLMPAKGKVIGNCPACGSPVAEMQRSWSCTDPKCKFAIWKDNNYFKKLGKAMTPQLAEKLMKEGKAFLKGCHSAKNGKSYNATVLMTTDSTGRPVYELRFENGGKKKS